MVVLSRQSAEAARHPTSEPAESPFQNGPYPAPRWPACGSELSGFRFLSCILMTTLAHTAGDVAENIAGEEAECSELSWSPRFPFDDAIGVSASEQRARAAGSRDRLAGTNIFQHTTRSISNFKITIRSRFMIKVEIYCCRMCCCFQCCVSSGLSYCINKHIFFIFI